MASRTSQIIAARAGIAQTELLAQADAAALAVDAAIAKAWRQLLRLLHHPPPYFFLRHAVYTILATIPAAARDTLRKRLTGLVRHGHKSAGHVLARSLPRKQLASRVVLREDAPPNVGPGIRFGLSTRRQLRAEPVVGKNGDRLERLLFNPPTQAEVDAILRRPVAGRDWEQDLSAASNIAGFDPNQMANTIAVGFSLGKKPAEIARDLLPVVDNVRSSARRIARTYGVQVARHGQMQAHAALGDFVIGYQVHATLDQHTRDWHAARDGEIYYLEPEDGQKGLDQMPNPPLEPEDPNERPAGEPRMAWY